MKNRTGLVVLGMGALALSGAAQADGLGFGVRGSSLGAGIELTKSLGPSFNARVGYNKYDHEESQTEDGIQYDADVAMQSTHAMLDWHPFRGGFRITAGYVFSNNELALSAKGTGEVVDIGNVSVPLNSSDSLDAAVDLNSGAYVGLGWGNGGQRGFGFTFDVGVYMGSPEVSLGASQSVRDKITLAGSDPDVELQREEDNLQDDLDEYEQYPVVSLGISYGF